MIQQGKKDTYRATTTAFAQWLPTVAFADALAFAVMFVSLVLFKRLGKGNGETTFYTSLLFTPWLLRPIIDHYLPQTARLWPWIAGTEVVAAIVLAVLAAILPNNGTANNVTLLLWLVSFGGAIHSVATERLCDRAITGHSRTVFALRMVGFLVAMALCQGLAVALAGNMEVLTRTIRSSWSATFYLLAAIFLVLSLLHIVLLGRNDTTTKPSVAPQNFPLLNLDRRALMVMALLLLTLVPGALTLQVEQLFLIDARHNGGLGLSPSEYGLVQGTVGMVALAIGSVVGLFATHRCPFGKWLMPMAAAATLPVGAYLYLSFSMTGNLTVICLCVSVNLLSLGFALSVLYRIIAVRCQSKLIATALVSIPLVVVGFFSGSMQESMGYRTFFATILSLTPLALAAIAFANTLEGRWWREQ